MSCRAQGEAKKREGVMEALKGSDQEGDEPNTINYGILPPPPPPG